MLTEQAQQQLTQEVINQARHYQHGMSVEYFLTKVISASMSKLEAPTQEDVLRDVQKRGALFAHVENILTAAAEKVDPGSILDMKIDREVLESAFQQWSLNHTSIQ